MTLEEAKQLKPGDRVLVEAEVVPSVTARFDGNSLADHISSQGNLSVKVASSGHYKNSFWVCAPEAIREKIAPPRRKFRGGDIVRYTGSGALAYVNRDEFEDGRVFAGGWTTPYKAEELILICAVENREDMNAAREANAGEPAAAPSELWRGNLASKIGGEP